MKLALLGGTPVRNQPFTAWPIFGKPEEKRLLRTLHSGKWGKLNGPEVAEFEKRFAAMHGCKHGIGVVNGTVSLRIALLAAGIRAEDEVIIPTYTFFSTASAVIEANAVPVFADIDLDTFNLDPKAVAAAITPRTRAIIPVHFAGQPADMQAIMAIARKHKLVVIEDAAHAHGASYRNRPAGSIGHIASFSFQSSKNLTSGEGGILTTNDDTLAAACRSIHNCGRIPTGIWYEHHVISGNYRLGEFQGAVLNAQLDRLETQTQDAQPQRPIPRVPARPVAGHASAKARCRLHPAQLPPVHAPGGWSRSLARRAPRCIKALQAEGIPCSAGYGFSLHQQPMFRNQAFGPYLPKVSAKLNYQKTQCPEQRPDLPRAMSLARTRHFPRHTLGHGRCRPRV